MNGDAHNPNSRGAPVRSGDKPEAGPLTGGIGSASRLMPVEWAQLKARHDAAIHILKHEHTSVEERYELLMAVVWPDHKWLRDFGEAA